ncbi:MAG: HAMP domain-containing protein [Myxococcales bacterium]|nr:HAMP domain-containing protein [Myxococcales bacterium]
MEQRAGSLSRRVLAAFAVVVVAFAATVAAGLFAQRRAAQEVAALSLGYTPLETALARARAAQWTVAARLDRLLDDPRAAGTTRDWLLTVARGRPAVLAEARAAIRAGLVTSPDPTTRAFGEEVLRELDALEKNLDGAARDLPPLFGALEANDKARAETLLRALSARERGAATRLDDLAGRIGERRRAVVQEGVARDQRAIVISVGLALVSLVVAALGTRDVRRRLQPLGRLTERAKAIAAGDRSPVPAELLPGPDTKAVDEIAQLGAAFGAMVEGVASRDADLLRLQRRQEDIVNHLRAAVLALRADGRIDAANPAARTLLGASEGGRLAEVSPALWALVAQDVSAAADEGREPAARSAVTLPQEGRDPLVLDVRVVPMRGDDARRALLVADDVSEAAAAQKRALQAERLAAIGKMAAHVTHEIRNPLSSIGLNAELLDETLASEHASAEARRLLTAIVREVGRLSDVSEEYLRVARLPSPRPDRVDLGALVREVAAFAKPELERARVQVVLALPEVPAVVSIDEAQVRQALVNLIRNAREAMEEGGTLTLGVRHLGATVELSVADEGAGIPEDVRARIFDPFFTTKSTGTGLGLPLTRQILEAHGGGIACLPGSPRGTEFRLTFPAPSASERLPPVVEAPDE